MESDRELRQRLAETPLPEGFLERLRSVARECAVTDDELDDVLRGPMPPVDFLSRLRSIPDREPATPLIAIRDEELNARLRACPWELELSGSPAGIVESLPSDLRDRLYAIAGEAVLSDGELDERLRETPVPPNWPAPVVEVLETEALRELLAATPPVDLPIRLRRLPVERRSSRFRRAVLAASLIFLICGAYWGAIGGMLESLRPAEPVLDLVVVDDGPLQLESPVRSVVLSAPRNVAPEPAPRDDSLKSLEWLVRFDRPTFGPVDEVLSQTGRETFYEDVLLLKWGFLGAPSRGDDEAPDLMTVSLPVARGVEPPLVRGYDRKFLLREKCSPAISPAAHPELRTVTSPLTTSTASYERTLQAAAAERFPDARDVRIEDFLAAMPYRYPTPKRGLASSAAGGPSRFAANGAGLLQIGVQAAGMLPRPPVHLTIALDTSAAMRWSSQFDQSRLAVARLLGHLTQSDRFSLVAFDEEAHTVVERSGPEAAEETKRLLSRMEPRGGTNLSAGLQQAVVEALAEGGDRRERLLIVVTDTSVSFEEDTLSKIERLLGRATASGLRLALFDWSRDGLSPLDGCMVRCGGEYQTATSETLGWKLAETLGENSSLIAKNAKLKIEFNPKSVLFYRLLGHHTDALAGLSPVEPAAELRALESSTALFEIGLKPGGEKRVAIAKLQWNDPKSGALRRTQRVINRDLFVNSFVGSPPELQAAAIAAETAEIVARNFFAQNQTRNLRGVLRAVESVHSDLRVRAEFDEFVDLLRRLEEIRIRRGAR